jgi:hypothetical protein
MRMRWTSRALVAVAWLVTAPALAHQAPLRTSTSDVPDDELDLSAATTTPVVPGGRAGGARMRRPPIDPPATTTDLRAALQATQADLQQCLATAGLAGSLRVTARISTSHSLALDITTPRSEQSSHACAELVLRRALTGLAGRPIARPLRSSLTVRRRATRSPPPPTATSAFDGPVHAAIDRDRIAMLQCLSAGAPGVVGTAALRVTLSPDGSLMLTSATLPPGIDAGPALPCLSARIAQLRFAPAPPSAMAIEHTLPLGL